MFDSILKPKKQTDAKRLCGVVCSLLCHAALIGGGIAVSAGAAQSNDDRTAPVVTFFAPPPPPPPPLGAAQETRPQVTRPQRKPDTVVESKQTPQPQIPQPVAETTVAEGGSPDGVPGGVQGGVPGGEQGGVVGGVLGGVPGGKPGGVPAASQPPPPPPSPPAEVVVQFGPGMERPVRIAGRDPEYTSEALAARVEGTIVVRCVITTQGLLRGCRVVRSLPYMDRAVLEALATHRYRPVLVRGRPTNVDYVFNIHLTLDE